jgi:hypothetical protein
VGGGRKWGKGMEGEYSGNTEYVYVNGKMIYVEYSSRNGER